MYSNRINPFIPLCLLVSLVCISCSPFRSSGAYPSGGDPLDVDFASLKRDTSKDAQIEKNSQMILAYLRGQLSLNEENPDRALRELALSSSLNDEPAPMLHSQLAILYLHSGELEKALHASEETLLYDRSTRNLLLHAGILESLGRVSDSVPIYNELITLRPDITAPYILLAMTHVNENRREEAIEVLQSYVKRKPKDLKGYYFLAHCYELVGNAPSAERNLKRSYELSKQGEKIGLDYVRLLLESGKVSQAKRFVSNLGGKSPAHLLSRNISQTLANKSGGSREALERLSFLKEFPTDPTTLRTKLALTYVENNDLEQATRELILVLASKPNDTRSRYYLGSVFAASGRKRLATTELMRVRAGEPMYMESRTFASFLFRQLDELKMAEGAVREALDVNPNDMALQLQLVDILRDAGDFEEAEEVVLKSLESNPENERFLFIYGVIAHELEKDHEAHQAMERVISMNPNNSQALNYIAYTMAENGHNLDQALGYAHRALAISPDDGFFLDTLGWVHYRRGEYAEAVELLEKAVDLTGNDIVIMEHYGDCLDRLGDRHQAAVVYNSAIKRAKASRDREELKAVSRIESKLKQLLKRNPELSSLL